MTTDLVPELLLTRLHEEHVRLWRELRSVTRDLTRVEGELTRVRADHAERLAHVERGIRGMLERERNLHRGNPVEVGVPQRMIAFAEGCIGLGEALAADAYLAHDNLALLAAKTLREAYGGRIVYDAIESPDRHPAPDATAVESFLHAFDAGIRGEVDAFSIVGPGTRVTILSLRDAGHDHRIADTLLRQGCAVTIVGARPPERPNPAIAYHVVDVER